VKREGVIREFWTSRFFNSTSRFTPHSSRIT
jgi:hypothetical protein